MIAIILTKSIYFQNSSIYKWVHYGLPEMLSIPNPKLLLLISLLLKSDFLPKCFITGKSIHHHPSQDLIIHLKNN